MKAWLLAILATGSGPFQIIDADTVRQNGETYRIVGLNTPEIHGDCPDEERLARKASSRLRELASRAILDPLPGTCGYGRKCGRITIDGRDWADIAISEGLAEPYICRNGHCPRRRDWCSNPLPKPQP